MTTRSNTDWLRDARWGVLTHYLCDPTLSADEWNRRVDAFDVRGLADQLASVGAPYYFMTIGQNSGHYCSPNATYDELTGISPSKCSRRDLIADLYDALAPRGIRLLVYLPCSAPMNDPLAVERLEWKFFNDESPVPVMRAVGDPDHPERYRSLPGGRRLVEFQRRWEAIIREWSVRWGRRVSGWWIDGCYWSDAMYRRADEPNFASFVAALKAGNSDSIVAFNGGVVVPLISVTEHEDYTAGEISDAFPICCGRWVDGAQYHVLSYCGETWGNGEPRFLTELVVGYTKYINTHEGVVTWDVPIEKHGRIPEPFVAQLRALADRSRPRNLL